MAIRQSRQYDIVHYSLLSRVERHKNEIHLIHSPIYVSLYHILSVVIQNLEVAIFFLK